jgi:hypothetical protein
MNNRATFLKREIIFGTYFVGQWIETSGAKDINGSLQVLSGNPFKYVPIFLQTAVNTSAEINGLEKVGLFDVIDEIDNEGGIGSETVEKLLKVFADSITANVGKTKAVKQAPQAKK